MPLIAEEKLDLAPRNFRLQQRIACEQSVQYFRRGTAGERDVKEPFSWTASRAASKNSAAAVCAMPLASSKILISRLFVIV